MSTATTEELSLAVRFREIATRAHNATRERDRLRPVDFPAWGDLPIDQREAWVAVARDVLASYVRKDFDREGLVRAATDDVYRRLGMVLDRRDCELAARAALAVPGLVAAPA